MKLSAFIVVTLLLSVGCFVVSFASARYAGYKGDDVGKFIAESYMGSKDFAVEVAQEVKIPAAEMNAVVVDVPGQKVRIQEGEGDQIVVKLSGKLIRGNKQDTVPEIIQTQLSAQALKIGVNESALRSVVDTSSKSGNWHINMNGISMGSGVTLDIFLPSQIKNIETHSTSGDVELLSGDYETVYTRAGSGDIKVKNIRAQEFIFELSSGDFDGEFDFESLKGEASSGDIELKLHRADPQIDVVASSGDIQLRFPGEPDARITALTSSGEIDLLGAEDQRNRVDVSLGSAKGLVQIRTSSGDIEVDREL